MNFYYDPEQAAEFDRTDIRAITHEDGDAEYQANLPSREEINRWGDEEMEAEYYRQNCCPNGNGFNGLCGYYKQWHGPNNECPRNNTEAREYHNIYLRQHPVEPDEIPF